VALVVSFTRIDLAEASRAALEIARIGPSMGARRDAGPCPLDIPLLSKASRRCGSVELYEEHYLFIAREVYRLRDAGALPLLALICTSGRAAAATVSPDTVSVTLAPAMRLWRRCVSRWVAENSQPASPRLYAERPRHDVGTASTIRSSARSPASPPAI